MTAFGRRKDGRAYPKHHSGGGTSRHTLESMKDQDKNRSKSIHALNYHGGDYTGPNPSHRSRVLDRKRHNKNQPWEK